MSDLELMDLCANCRNDIFVDNGLGNSEFFSKDIKDSVAPYKTDQVDIAILNRSTLWRKPKALREFLELGTTQ